MALPDDESDREATELMVSDLTVVRWKMSRTGKIQIESKEDIKERIKRSTDYGDSVVQACWPVRRRGRMTFAGRVGPRPPAVVGSAA